jgi:hypothetical protein
MPAPLSVALEQHLSGSVILHDNYLGVAGPPPVIESDLEADDPAPVVIDGDFVAFYPN